MIDAFDESFPYDIPKRQRKIPGTLTPSVRVS
ncbi:hypothetical protein BH160DRAFT_1880 [Burkholderia sp. H160]|nr:hypothetical protein BH160DRAFT_1880 [Burkholderia sp. H160]